LLTEPVWQRQQRSDDAGLALETATPLQMIDDKSLNNQLAFTHAATLTVAGKAKLCEL